MSMHNLLVELFVEELPPKALKKLGEAFAAALFESLKAQGLAGADSVVTPYASPRRLAVHVTEVAAQAADKPVSHKLMPVSVGLDANGQATPALLKKLGALGLDASVVPQLKRAPDGKAEALFFDSTAKGALLADGLQKALDEAIAKLPIPKVMTYQLADGWSTVDFVRPVHGLVALHGAEVVNIGVLGLSAGHTTQGHRFEAKSGSVSLKDADSYAAQMESEGAVIPSYEVRCLNMIQQLLSTAKNLGLQLEVARGLTDAEAEVVLPDNALIQEVTALVERPNVLVGRFEQEFLAVPQECLILTMKANQKYFPLLDAAGKLSNQFLIVSNISPADASQVVGGNERVVRPRLADAKFFFDQDRKKSLESRVLDLAKVVYHNQLGTQGDRVQRVRAIAQEIAKQLGDETLERKVEQAALLAKTDLLTDMVGEFPELQGIMGRYYALNDGLSADVADAIEDHYKPRFAGDELPRNSVGLCVALADKLETLVGLFSIGQRPTGDKDPFALRRHALGVVRMLIDENLSLELEPLLDKCCVIMDKMLEDQIGATTLGHGKASFVQSINPAFSPLVKDLWEFFNDRLSNFLREQGYTAQEVEAVLSLRPQRLGDIPKRLVAVRVFVGLPEAEALAAANKRIQNILKKTEAVADAVEAALLQEGAERALYEQLLAVRPKVEAALANLDYTAALKALAGLRAAVDRFFDEVMVMVDEPLVRNNRLALLTGLAATMNSVADIGQLSSR